MDLLVVIDEHQSHYVYISKIWTDLCFTKQRIKKKIVRFVCSVLVVKMYGQHKEVHLNTNSAQSVKLEKGTIEFKNYFKQIRVPFKIYADFECNFKSVESYEGSYSKNIKITFLVVLLTNLSMLMINLPSQ